MATTWIDVSDDQDGSELVEQCVECGALLGQADHHPTCQTIVGGRSSDEWRRYYDEIEEGGDDAGAVNR